jgi:glycosyltransferase involved in cell wall biosynthesis
MPPLVTVITPTYNAAAFIAETVGSVLAQTHRDVEHLLVDDASSDATPDLLRELAHSHPDRIRVDLKTNRAGPCHRRNDALDLAHGELIGWLDHDDVWLPDKLERQVGALAADPDVALAFSQYETFDGRTGETLFASTLDAAGDLYERLFVEGCFIASSTVLFRRSAMAHRMSKLRESDFSFGDDYDLWLTLLLDGRAVLIDQVLTRIRRHEANETTRIAKRNFHLDRIRLLEEHLANQPDSAARLGSSRRRGLAAHYASAAGYELDRGNRSGALRLALSAAGRRPLAAARFVAGTARRSLRDPAAGQT